MSEQVCMVLVHRKPDGAHATGEPVDALESAIVEGSHKLEQFLRTGRYGLRMMGATFEDAELARECKAQKGNSLLVETMPLEDN